MNSEIDAVIVRLESLADWLTDGGTRPSSGRISSDLRALLSAYKAQRDGAGRYLVWSNEHRAWWGADKCGYTRRVERAGRYSRAEAILISSVRGGGWQASSNPDEIAIPEADAIEQYLGVSAALTGEPSNV